MCELNGTKGDPADYGVRRSQCYDYALAIVIFCTAIASLFVVFRVFGFGQAGLLAMVASALAAIACTDHESRWRALVLLLATSVVSLLLASLYFDMFWDGMSYHQDSILFFAEASNPLTDIAQTKYAYLTNDYPKFSWYFSAAVFDVTGNIHLAKSLNFMLTFSALLLALQVFSNHTPGKRWLFSLIIVANPIITNQLWSHYVDGLMASLITVAILALHGVWVRTLSSQQALVIGAFACLGCANLKFTGAVFGAILFMVIITSVIYSRRSEMYGLRRALVGTNITLALLIMCAATLLYNPYFKHLSSGQHIFHPVMGEAKIPNIISSQASPKFNELNRLQQLFYSIFSSPSSHAEPPSSLSELKVPFSVSQQDIKESRNLGSRMAGWGIFFSGILLTSFLLFGLRIVRGKTTTGEIVLVGLLLLLSTISSASWWARLNPQLYTMAAMCLIYGYTEVKPVLFKAIFLIVILNLACSLFPLLANVHSVNKKFTAELRSFSERSSDGRIYWFMQLFRIDQMILKAGISVVELPSADEASDLHCEETLYFQQVLCIRLDK